jgi:hypothetical protein
MSIFIVNRLSALIERAGQMKVEGGIHGRKLQEVAVCVAGQNRERETPLLQHDALTLWLKHLWCCVIISLWRRWLRHRQKVDTACFQSKTGRKLTVSDRRSIYSILIESLKIHKNKSCRRYRCKCRISIPYVWLHDIKVKGYSHTMLI